MKWSVGLLVAAPTALILLGACGTKTPGTASATSTGTGETPPAVSAPASSASSLAVSPSATSSATKPDDGVAAASKAAVQALDAYLKAPSAQRPEITEQPFASVPLTKDDAARAADLLATELAVRTKAERRAELDAQSIKVDEATLRFEVRRFGDAPSKGHALFLSLHGGGGTTTETNDSQWRNQVDLYKPSEGIYVAPRAPTDAWNMWFVPEIEPLFDRLIADFVALEGVDPDRVYVMGYSAGGDGVYQIGPRMADRWAAAAMMAGHPNDSSPLGLRNIGFTIHVGADDNAFDRNKVGAEWGKQLDLLHQSDPSGYVHEVQIHAGKGHWMDLEDAVAVPWMQQFTRNPIPEKVVWVELGVPTWRCYWLATHDVEVKQGARIVATRGPQSVRLESVEGFAEVIVRLSDAMMDLDRDITITLGERTLFRGKPARTIAALFETLGEREYRAAMFPSQVIVRP
ncbi:MAG: hypothetical protein U0414_26960 [Polyangiaceae bacterium]